MSRRVFAVPPPMRSNAARSAPRVVQPPPTVKNILNRPNSAPKNTTEDQKNAAPSVSASTTGPNDSPVPKNTQKTENTATSAASVSFPLTQENYLLDDREEIGPCAESQTKNGFLQFSQIAVTKTTQNTLKLMDTPIKFKISVLNRQMAVFPVSLTFIAKKDELEFVGSINYKAILQFNFENFDQQNYEYERIESIECGPCRVQKQENCSKCSKNYFDMKKELLKKCSCHNCTCAAINFLNRCAKNPQPCKRTFVRKRRKFGNLSCNLVLYHESNSAPDYLISTAHRMDSTYMLNRIDQNKSTAILKLANILLDIKVSPESNNQAQFSEWTQWTEFEIVDAQKTDCQCESTTKLPQTTAQPQSIDDNKFRCFELLHLLESFFSFTANLTILEHPKDYNIQWQLQVGPVL